jgi:NADH:ubiquinone oxidoreductase subunit 5 (subunit L)/multisubunit Na+/H+ antiporter MnhA subunit
MLWLLPLLPVITAPVVWATGRHRPRLLLGATTGSLLGAITALAVWAAVTRPHCHYEWGGGLSLRLAVDDTAAVVAVLVPAVALVVAVYASAHEPDRGLGRLVATLVGFVGAMELLVLAADMLTLLIAWELVGACSWALIAHDWWKLAPPPAAVEAFVVTHLGDLGLFAAAAAVVAATGTLSYDSLGGLDGGWLHLFVAGVVLAAAAKSAQVPFSPWLFAAMEGPTSVSALLHSATMVAAGAYALIRLHPVMDRAGWFAPTVITLGLVTALAGGVIASLQQHAKRVLAASTSAQYGLMFVAVGAGVPAAALAHLVTHAVFKSGLFLAAGIAIEAAGSAQVGRMCLGRSLRITAIATALLAVALGAVPPLGGAWTKEAIGAAAGEWAPWLAVGVAAAGGLSAFYAARFALLTFGPPASEVHRTLARRPGTIEQAAVAAAALASVVFGVAYWPGARTTVSRLAGGALPAGSPWETALSLAMVAVAVYAASALFRSGRLLGDVLDGGRGAVADWFAFPALAKTVVVDPTLRLSTLLARFDDAVITAPPRAVAALGRRLPGGLARVDDRVVDAGIRATAAVAAWLARLGATVSERGVEGAVAAVAGLVGQGGRDTRRLHTGRAHQYYVVVTAGAVVLLLLTAVGR